MMNANRMRLESGAAEMWRRFAKLGGDDGGATAIEYAIMATGIALAIVVVVGGIGSELGGFFVQVSSGLK